MEHPSFRTYKIIVIFIQALREFIESNTCRTPNVVWILMNIKKPPNCHIQWNREIEEKRWEEKKIIPQQHATLLFESKAQSSSAPWHGGTLSVNEVKNTFSYLLQMKIKMWKFQNNNNHQCQRQRQQQLKLLKPIRHAHIHYALFFDFFGFSVYIFNFLNNNNIITEEIEHIYSMPKFAIVRHSVPSQYFFNFFFLFIYFHIVRIQQAISNESNSGKNSRSPGAPEYHFKWKIIFHNFFTVHNFAFIPNQ